MNSAEEPTLTLADHQAAFVKVSFLLEIFAATVHDLMGGATDSVGRIAGREMAKKMPVYIPNPRRTTRPAARSMSNWGVALLDRLEGERTLIVVDAVQLDSPPGAMHVLEWDDLPPAGGPAVSAHGIGVREAVEISRCLIPEKMPSRVTLVGVEGRCFDRVGQPLTAEVAAGTMRATGEVLRLLQRS